MKPKIRQHLASSAANRRNLRRAEARRRRFPASYVSVSLAGLSSDAEFRRKMFASLGHQGEIFPINESVRVPPQVFDASDPRFGFRTE